ncbi:MAG: IclR family transcriptional regulator [Lentisphaeria bacterium]|jgi:IclR family acetate operon transcriptional repressor|nr:IclR family transcriptional regulator [Lentisphaeria bacterium]
MTGTIRKACGLLRLLDGAGAAGLRLADLAGAAGLPPATARRLLATLAGEGFAAQSPENRRYRLGPAAIALGHPAPRRERLQQAAAAPLRELRDETGETVALVGCEDGRRCLLATCESRQPLRVVPAEGDDERFYETATGRALLARLGEPELPALLRRLGWPGRRWPGVFTDRDLERELQVIRATGLAVAEQRESAITALATPLAIPGFAAAIGLDYPAGRDSGGRRQTLAARLRETAEIIRDAYLENR